MKRIFRLHNMDWVFSDGKKFVIEISEDDEDYQYNQFYREPKKEEAEEILKKLIRR